VDSDEDKLLETARSGDLSSRLDLADNEKAGRAVFEVLSSDPAPEVHWMLARNHAIPRDLLEQLSARSEKLRELVQLNPNAPASLKEPAPLWQHIQTSLETYLDDQQATDEERATLISAWMQHDASSLGEVWGRIRGPQ
jgi:hypothetical protein